MSDDEYAVQSDHEEEEAEPEPFRSSYVEPEEHHEEESHPPPSFHHEPESRPEDSEEKSEAQLRMEMEMKKRKERENEEWNEYEEMRKEERQKEEEEIQRLREKKEKRRKEREEEERRLAELRAVEEQRRRAEEEERQRRKRAEEEKRKAEREEKKKAANEQKQMVGKRNFVINKKNDGMDVGGSSQSQQETAKSKEQLEHEKRAILEQRIQPLQIDGMGMNQLQEKAKDLYHHIYRLEGDKYDLEDRFKRQQYDLMELAERARQMNKGGKQKVQVQTNEPDHLSEKMSGIPPKITMYSQYERVKDPRSFGDRRDVYSGPLFQEMYQRIVPTNAIVMTDQGPEVSGPYAGPGAAQNGPPQEATENVTLEVEE